MLNTPTLRPNLPNDVAGWLELDRQYRIRDRYDISQVLVRGKGVSVWDANGKEYIDFESGQVCTSTGHCHPDYTRAIIEQAQTLVQTGSGYTSPARVMLAKKLAEIMRGDLECSYFACTGSEATEAALRLAKLHIGRSEIVSLVRGYHARSSCAGRARPSANPRRRSTRSHAAAPGRSCWPRSWTPSSRSTCR